MLLRHDSAMTALAVMMEIAFHAGWGQLVRAADITERLGHKRHGTALNW